MTHVEPPERVPIPVRPSARLDRARWRATFYGTFWALLCAITLPFTLWFLVPVCADLLGEVLPAALHLEVSWGTASRELGLDRVSFWIPCVVLPVTLGAGYWLDPGDEARADVIRRVRAVIFGLSLVFPAYALFDAAREALL